MRLARIVEVDDEELGLYLIGIEMRQEMVVCDLREVWELVIVDVHGESHEALILEVEDVVHEVVLEQATHPHTSHEEADIPHGEGKDVE